jgi:flagellar protein FliS
VTALQIGVSGAGNVPGALHQFYGAVRKSLLDGALNFDAEALETIRQDLNEISAALLAAKTDA